ncbi:zona pellucida-like domain-containing protein 1 [Pundamilia nyererei]|uniref:Zona pellucida-like domain-containing protein 1 n=1 Tax=Pundamilia nyererei TaxID=303518 RepID=A0A9Y3RHA7_9CICH|nr:PREDICTED: zona pellucida-like domain-containing protein 1 [Pundamilia nyererei]
MITYRPQIRYNFSCTYRMKYLFNNTKLSVFGGTSSIKSNDGRLFNMLSMQLYKDKQCQEILTIPETGLEVKTKIYVEVQCAAGMMLCNNKSKSNAKRPLWPVCVVYTGCANYGGDQWGVAKGAFLL